MNTLETLKVINKQRCESVYHSIEGWSPTDWACAVAGEVGEMCNFIKKMRRGDNVSVSDVAKEAADVVIYLDLLAQRLGFDLSEAIRAKFDEVSDRVKSDIKFPSEEPVKDPLTNKLPAATLEDLEWKFRKACTHVFRLTTAGETILWNNFLPAIQEVIAAEKKEAIAFAEWSCKEGWNYYKGKWHKPDFQSVKTEQLYSLYKQQQ